MTRIGKWLVGGLVLCLGAQALADEKPVRLELRRAFTKNAKGREAVALPGKKQKLYLAQKAELTHKDFAEAGLDASGKSLEVRFTDEGAKRLKKITKEHIGERLAILVDGKLISAPVIRAEIGARAVLSGLSRETMQSIIDQVKKK